MNFQEPPNKPTSIPHKREGIFATTTTEGYWTLRALRKSDTNEITPLKTSTAHNSIHQATSRLHVHPSGTSAKERRSTNRACPHRQSCSTSRGRGRPSSGRSRRTCSASRRSAGERNIGCARSTTEGRGTSCGIRCGSGGGVGRVEDVVDHVDDTVGNEDVGHDDAGATACGHYLFGNLARNL